MGIIDKFRIDGKVALITGGSEGIGLAMGIAYGQAGAKVCISGRSEEKLKAAKEIYKSHGIEVFTWSFDVSIEEEVEIGIKEIARRVGTIEILVNNAGIIKRSPILDMKTEDFREVIEIDLVAPFVVSKKVVPGMMKMGRGKIINLCSMMSEYGRNSVAAYASAKGGLKLLTKNMCVEWAKYNIQVNAIGPGYIKTVKTEDFAKEGHPFNKLVKIRTPAQRWGTPEDMAGAALLLASEAGNYINGHTIYVDGGILANFGYLETEIDA